MKKLIFGIFLLISLFTYSQEPFRYDTIFVAPGDARNIHRNHTTETLPQQLRKQAPVQQRSSSSASGFDTKDLRYGLNFGLNFTTNYSLFRLAPQVGYQFNKYMMAGVGVSYFYSKNRIYHQEERVNLHSNTAGANVFGYLYPASMLVISVQPEVNYVWSSYKGDQSGKYNSEKNLVTSFVVGAGLRLGVAHAMLYYDLVQDANSPYSSGIFYGVSVYF